MNTLGKFQAFSATALMAVSLVAPFAQTSSTNLQGTADQGQGQPAVREHGRRGFGRHFGRQGFGRIGQKLNLSDAQKAQMKQIATSYRERDKSLRDELRAKRQELRQAQQNGTFNEALAAQKLAEVAPLKARLMGERFKMRQEMLAVLTPEQKTQLDQLRQEFKTKREQFKSRKAERPAQQG